MPERYITIYSHDNDITLLQHNINQTSLEVNMFTYINSIVQYLNENGFNTNPSKQTYIFDILLSTRTEK